MTDEISADIGAWTEEMQELIEGFQFVRDIDRLEEMTERAKTIRDKLLAQWV